MALGGVSPELVCPRERHHSIDSPGEVVSLIERVADRDADGDHPADQGGVVDLVGVLKLSSETLAQGEPGVDGEPGGALLQGVGQARGEDEHVDEAELKLRPGPGAGDHGARAHGAGRQHRPVQHRNDLLEEIGRVHVEIHDATSCNCECLPITMIYSVLNAAVTEFQSSNDEFTLSTISSTCLCYVAAEVHC